MTAKPAFSTVYQQYKHKLYSYVWYRAGQDAMVTEDIVSDIFLKAYRNYERYDSQYALSTWLYAIARNTLIDHYRKDRAVVDIDGLDVADTTDPLFLLIDEHVSRSEVLRAIEELPEEQRVFITAQFFDGKTAKEIANEAGKSHAAVRKIISRGVAALRTALLSGLVLCNYHFFL